MPLSSLPGHIHTAPADRLYDDLAFSLMAAANEAVEKRGVFHLALSGGTTPEPFFVRLVIDPRFRLIPWPQTEFWQVDERIVPDDDDQRNLKMIRETLTDQLPIRSRQVHAISVLEPDPAGEYEAELGTFSDQGIKGAKDNDQGNKRSRDQGKEQEGRLLSPRSLDPSVPRSLPPFPLDFVLLGLGSDGHTASLFPGSPALTEKDRWIVRNDGPRVTPPPRVTMTYPLLNAARRLAVLVTGPEKASILRQINNQLRDTGPDPQRFPVTGLQSAGGQLSWWLDTAAAGETGPT